MSVVFKFRIQPWTREIVDAPVGSKPLRVGWQEGPYGYGAFAWFLCPSANGDQQAYPIVVVPTGLDADVGDYIGTFETPTGEVFHVFARGAS